MTAKSLMAKSGGFSPSIETTGRIDASDKTLALQGAGYRLTARLHELEGQFQAKAAELRSAYLAAIWRRSRPSKRNKKR